MCGIVGYVGGNNAKDYIIDGLKKLEYRGYDSAGIALQSENGIVVRKKEGKINVNTIGALIVGIGVSILAKIDIFAMQGISLSIPLIGWILTGVLMSRGANFIHDLFNKIGDKGV